MSDPMPRRQGAPEAVGSGAGSAETRVSIDVAVELATAKTRPFAGRQSVGPAPDGGADALPLLDLPARYRGDGILGRGGMGAVYGLDDTVLRRKIAAKTLFPDLAGDPGQVQSFVEEAQLTAQLDHPNIVPVHDLGTDANGNVYFTMKRVRGRTFNALLADPALPLGSSERLSVALEVFLKACDALAFAHSRGVLHRDLKPANVMVGEYGEVYLMDWGLAKILEDGSATVSVARDPNSALGRSVEGIVGTPAFMAPEVANRAFHRVDQRTDIFGMGGVLYQVATGRLPYDGATLEEVMARARACDWKPPDEYEDALVPKKLARVIARAMAREPDDRYPTVSALATHVREFLHRGHHLPRVVHPKGTIIVRQGDPGDQAYIVTRGRCEIFRGEGDRRRVLREVGPGGLFGESAILRSAPRLASVVALTDVTTLVLTREILEERLAPDTWEGLLTKTLIERFRELDAKEEEALTLSGGRV